MTPLTFSVDGSAPKPEPVCPMPSKPDFGSMTKAQLEKFGRTIGIELDKRLTHKKLVALIEEAVNA